MSNSIRRPRRRPRRRSVNFRSLWWVVLREASIRVLFPGSLDGSQEPTARMVCGTRDTWALVRCVQVVLVARPERRFYEPPASPAELAP